MAATGGPDQQRLFLVIFLLPVRFWTLLIVTLSQFHPPRCASSAASLSCCDWMLHSRHCIRLILFAF